MITRFTLSLVLLLFLQNLTITLAITVPPFNISHFLYPKIYDELRPPQPSLFFKDVLEAISEKQMWNLEEIKASKLEVRKAKFGTVQRYEFRLRFGKGELVFKLSDGVSLWKKFKRGADFESFAKEVSPKAVLDTIRIEGPFELRVSGDDELSLMLPTNTSHTSLKRILVGEGITVEVRSAQDVSLFQTSDLHGQVNSSGLISRERSEFWSFWYSFCKPLLPIHISGSASVFAYRARNADAFIETAFLSKKTIELLPEKCYDEHAYRKWACPISSLSLRIALLEKLFRSFLGGDRISRDVVSGFLKATIKASTIFHFQMELERYVASNDTHWSTLAEWRTKPNAERVCFDVMAKIEAERLKPLVIKRVRPIVGVDSSTWSNLMSNISFTKFPSVLVPPEPLTLDVKW